MPARPRAVAAVAATATALALLALAPTPATSATGTPGPSLRALAAHRHLPIGTAVNPAALTDDTAYRKVLGQQFSSVTDEAMMKWKNTEAVEGVQDYTAADRLVSFAQAHGQRIYGHNLVWHQGSPTWLTEGYAAGEYTTGELRALLKQHITDEVKHFGTRVWAWDVVNEAFNEDGTLRDSIWLDALGPGYIADSFRWAHEANPSAKLFINDYNIEWVNAKSTAEIAFVKDLKDQGVPIDGIGFQTHRKSPLPQDYATVLQEAADAGFDVAVTELDNAQPLPVTDGELAVQADNYARALQACLAVSRCVSFSVWGFDDKYSFNNSSTAGAPDLFDENLQAKPAFYALRDVLAQQGAHR